MAITNAQQYQQLVNKPANGKRPGYRGPGGYQGSSGSSSSSSSSSSSNQGPAGGASAGGNYGGNVNAQQTYAGRTYANQNYATQASVNAANQRAAQRAEKARTDKIKADKIKADKIKADKIKADKIKADKIKKEKDLSKKGLENAKKLLGGLTAKERYLSNLRGIDSEDIEGDLSSDLQTYNTKVATGTLSDEDYETYEDVPLNKREQELQDFIDNRNTVPTFPGVTSLIKDPLQKFSDYSASINRPFFKDVIKAGKIPGLDFDMSAEEFEDAYKNYMANRLAGKTDAYGNPLGDRTYDSSGNLSGGRDNDGSNRPPPIISQQPTIPVTPAPVVGSTTSSDPFSLAPRFMGSIFDFSGPQFAADGGRVAAQRGGIMSQQGGSIMPRLSDLSGDVSSAEQMLQEINQRLQSAESTLGEGGGGGMFGAGNFGREGMFDIGHPGPGFNTNFNQQPRSPIAGSIQNQMQNSLNLPSSYTPFAGETFNQVPEQFKTGFDEYTKENPIGIGGAAMTSVGLQDGNRVMFSNTASAGAFSDYLKSIGQGVSPFGIRQGAMDGGRMRQMEMMEDEDDPEGGIMDLESGRQMYFLGKLVKKATRAVKKVAKSPLGKAALMYGLGAMGGSYGAGKGFFSKGMFNPGNMIKGLIGTKGAARTPGIGGVQGLFGKFGLTKGYGGIMPTLKGGIGLGIGVPMALDALGVGKEEEDNGLADYYKSQGIDIADIRLNPYKFMASRMAGSQFAADGGRMGYQEGGDAEPVAKKTMPLLDMDGQEMDLRAEGGFVPLGRMERADDVPARLSKNEFVFTADAVRNAGDGDIDKGAEVMYNMMKNLESGGEVSEESQGLDGAREMFQTSQRLEEVL